MHTSGPRPDPLPGAPTDLADALARLETRWGTAAVRLANGDAARRLGASRSDDGLRVEGALAAVTRNDLAKLTADLPRARRPRPDLDRLNPRAFREHLRSYLLVMALLVAIWALTGAGYFWPVWPALGWGIGILSHASTLRGNGRGDVGGAARAPHARLTGG